MTWMDNDGQSLDVLRGRDSYQSVRTEPSRTNRQKRRSFGRAGAAANHLTI